MEHNSEVRDRFLMILGSSLNYLFISFYRLGLGVYSYYKSRVAATEKRRTTEEVRRW